MTFNGQIWFAILTSLALVGCNLPPTDSLPATASFESQDSGNSVIVTPTSVMEQMPEPTPQVVPTLVATPTQLTIPEETEPSSEADFTQPESAFVAEAAPSSSGCSVGVDYQTLPFNDLDLWSVYQANVNADYDRINVFWQQTYPSQFGGSFPGVCHTVEYVPDNVPFQDVCGITPELAQSNAFYCSTANAVMWDGPTFYHQIYQDLGSASLTFITAHEYGHAAQILSGTMPVRSVNAELQADCYAGAYLGFAAEQGLLSADDARDVILIVAAVGQSRFGTTWLTRSHGTTLQREAATLRGFEEGVAGCQVDFSQGLQEDTRPGNRGPFRE